MDQKEQQMKEQFRKENLKKIKHKIVVLSGKGGVGKSTVSVNLAYALSLNGYKTGIMDVDIHGPSIAKMTGIEGQGVMASENQRAKPIEVVNNFYVLSLASMVESVDEPIIWRGPLKIGVIKQFLEDVDWPELDYLIVDCPPGTGDEALSVVQFLENVDGTVIVSTPQDVAFLDARKTINFSKKLNVPILGLVENMAGFVCPKCGEKVDIFKSGGAARAAKDFNLDILGTIPIDTNIVESGDNGKPFVYHFNKSEGAKEFMAISEKISEKVETQPAGKVLQPESSVKVLAMPLDNGKVSAHFGHAPSFVITEIQDGKVVSSKEELSPKHEPGVIPKWLADLGVNTLLCGGLGGSARNIMEKNGINVISGINEVSTQDAIDMYLRGELTDTGGTCDHSHNGTSCSH